MKILVTGASGLLGRALMPRLAALAGATGQLVGTAHTRLTPPLHPLDLTDAPAVREAFARYAPDLVVHAAAERRPDVVDGDPATAERINVAASQLLAELAAASAARFIYISTDYVFDGQAPPYVTEAEPAPLNAYGRMKLAGEAAVRAAYAGSALGAQGWAILRIPILYGRVQSLAESPVSELAVPLLQGRAGKVEDWATRYPAHADDVARAVALIAGRLMQADGGGHYHYPSGEPYTKYAMARLIAQEFSLDAALLHADPNPPAGAPRPKDCRLDGSRLTALGFSPAIRLADGLREALAPFVTARS